MRRLRKLPLISGLAVLALAVAVSANWRELALWYRLRSDFSLASWRNAQGYSEYRHRATGIILVSLPGGTFTMGSPENDPLGQGDERPAHQVSLDPFLIAKHEVSQARWRSVMRTEPSIFRGDDLPVETISWDEAHAFCEATGLRLPTEAQWEYACRAGSGEVYSPGERLGHDEARFGQDLDVEPGTVPVQSMSANGFGLHHMHGNVQEWCEDAYDRGFYARPAASERNPVQESAGAKRVLRGGGWSSPVRRCRCASRAGSDPALGVLVVGFRPAYYPLP